MTDTLFGMDAAPSADADPWAMRHGVPVDILDADGDPDTPVDYLRIGIGTTRDREFRAFRKRTGALALSWWIALLMLARRDGSFGVLDIDDVELAIEATGDAGLADDVPAMLEHAAAAGLLWLRTRDGVVTVRVRKWREWQVKSPRDRSRLLRARKRDADALRHATALHETSGRDSHATASNVTLQEETRQETDLSVGPPARASAPVREADDDPRSTITTALADLYPDPDLAARAADELWKGAFMRKARFRHGVTADAIVAGIRDLADHRRRDPAFTPRDVVEYVIGRATKWNPNAADLSLPTIENGDPRERPTIPSDPEFARFDGPARPR